MNPSSVLARPVSFFTLTQRARCAAAILIRLIFSEKLSRLARHFFCRGLRFFACSSLVAQRQFSG